MSIPRIHLRAGYRGRVLGFFGCAWIIIGLGVSQGLMRYAAGFTPWQHISAGIWTATGLASIAGAFMLRDRWFYALLMVAPACSATASLINGILSLIPGPPDGARGGLATFALYAALAGAVWLQTGVKEPGTETVSPAATAKFLADKDDQ